MIKITANTVSKRYSITTISKREKLRKKILQKWFGARASEGNSRYREALKAISFELERGDSLALIGRNGAGKSTLLKLVAGSLQADSGTLDVQGAVGGLVELGAGLDPLKTGRENARDRARLLGVPQEKITEFAEAISDFSELGEQFEDPINSYSTGMKARLGFAISVTLPFDIMICDEALSVGDANFAAKCLARVNEMKSERIFLFVSHSMSMVQRFCDRGIVLDEGSAVFAGSATDAVAFYENNILHARDSTLTTNDFVEAEQSSAVAEHRRSFLEPLLINKDVVAEWQADCSYDRGLQINWSLTPANAWGSASPYRLGFPVFASNGTMLFSCTNEDVLGTLINAGNSQNPISGSLHIPHHGLHPGVYYLVIAFYEGMAPVLRQSLGELTIKSDGIPRFGTFLPQHKWEISLPPPAPVSR